MVAAFLLSTFLSLPAAQSQPRTAPAFQPRLTVRFAPAMTPGTRQPAFGQSEIVCGMVVVRMPSDLDRKMLLPYRDTGAAVRRIEPAACAAAQSGPAK